MTVKEWLSNIDNWGWYQWSWVILGLFFIRFLIKDVPELYRMFKNTSNYGDGDPSGNDNINRKPYDYL